MQAMEYQIHGGQLPVVIMTLAPGERAVTEAGGMSWMSTNMKMETAMKGGLKGGLGRALAGDTVFLNTYEAQGGPGILACASSFPGSILAFDLAEGESIIAQKGAFLAGSDTIKLSIALRKKFSVGLLGGEGFVLQRIEGPGKVFLEIDGSYIKYSLKEGEQLIIDPGHMAVQSPTVQTELETVKGFKNVFLGGEGLFVAKLTGPGDVWLQTLTAANMARSIIPFIPKSN
jgi:uncharacterized protein (TIGR00266 family)